MNTEPSIIPAISDAVDAGVAQAEASNAEPLEV